MSSLLNYPLFSPLCQIEYKKRGEAGIGVTMLGRPDIELAKEVSKLTSQVIRISWWNSEAMTEMRHGVNLQSNTNIPPEIISRFGDKGVF